MIDILIWLIMQGVYLIPFLLGMWVGWALRGDRTRD